MRSFLLLLIFLFSANLSFSCQCVEIDSEILESFKNNNDYILVGTVLKTININPWAYHDKTEGIRVILRVDSIIKGQTTIGTEIFIYQGSSSSCSESFEVGSKHMIIGSYIKQFENYTEKELDDEDAKYYPIYSFSPQFKKDHIYKMKNLDDEILQTLKNLTNKYLTIETDMCRNFRFNSSNYNAVLSLLKEN